MPLDSHLNDALLFAAFALALVLISLSVRSPQRHAMLAMLADRRCRILASGSSNATARRSAADRDAARARSRARDRHVRRDPDHRPVRLPDAADASPDSADPDRIHVALALIGYVIYRLNAVGVNLASLITTSAIVTGALAFSAQETLSNLWGGIAIQLEKSCRIGDWVRVDNGHRAGRRHPVAVHGDRDDHQRNDRDTEFSVMKNRFTVVARRGEERTAWRATCRSKWSSTTRRRG